MRVRDAISKLRNWPEPQEGAGEGIGPLAGMGMYMQYDGDRKKHAEDIDTLISLLRTELRGKMLKLNKRKAAERDDHKEAFDYIQGVNDCLSVIDTVLGEKV